MHLPSQWLQSRAQLRLVAIVLVVVFWWQLASLRDYSDVAYSVSPPAPIPVVVEEAQSPCNLLQGLDDVFVILRTGANEVHERLPTHLNTTLRCLSPAQFGVWSDYEEDVDGQHVQNALDEIDPEIVATHPDFVYYQRLQENGLASFTAEEIAQWAAAPNSEGGRDIPGWKLDKWKFLPIADKAYRARQDVKWYLFMEADTYVSWESLLQWLSHIDASKPYYLGNQMQIGDDLFAYGGSGFLLSQPAMKKLVDHRATKPGVYEAITANHWAGDCVLGKALNDAGVDLSWQYPNFSGDMPFEMNYNHTFQFDRPLWCYYVTTYHHMSPADIKEVWGLQQLWNQKDLGLLRHSEVFRALVHPKLRPELENWDNHSADEGDATETFEECREACQARPQCLQFAFHGQDRSCKTSSDLSLGRAVGRVSSDSADQVISGWIMERVDAFVEAMDGSCDEHQTDWMLPD